MREGFLPFFVSLQPNFSTHARLFAFVHRRAEKQRLNHRLGDHHDAFARIRQPQFARKVVQQAAPAAFRTGRLGRGLGSHSGLHGRFCRRVDVFAQAADFRCVGRHDDCLVGR